MDQKYFHGTIQYNKTILKIMTNNIASKTTLKNGEKLIIN
jgi:hypothetical protein